MRELVHRLREHQGDDGASAVEYGLLVAGIAALIVAVVFLFGGVISNTFNGTCGKLSSAVATGTVSTTATCS